MSIKFPRIYHLPSSPKKGCDDKVAGDDYFRHLKDQEVVLTAKLDGGNTCVTMDGHVYARSHGQTTRDTSFDYLKSQMSSWLDVLAARQIDMYGENLYHIHTIEYHNLPSWFFIIGFRVRPTGVWLPWDETAIIAGLLNIPIVPFLHRGVFATQDAFERVLIEKSAGSLYGAPLEGIVTRKTVACHDADFHTHFFKWVNASFIIEGDHWRNKPRKVNAIQK